MVAIKGPLVRKLVGDTEMFDDMVKHHERTFFAQCKREELHATDHCLTAHVQSPERVDGLARLHRFEDLLENGFQSRNALFQKKFTAAVVGTMADWIVGEDWDRYGPDLIRERGWYNRSKGVIANAPRRFGKTMITSKVESAVAEVMQGSVQSTFSPSKRASVFMLDTVYKLLCELGLADKIVKYNQEMVWIKFGAKNDPLAPISKIYCFPSNPKMSSPNVAWLCRKLCYFLRVSLS